VTLSARRNWLGICVKLWYCECGVPTRQYESYLRNIHSFEIPIYELVDIFDIQALFDLLY